MHVHLAAVKPLAVGADQNTHGQPSGVPRLVPLPVAVKEGPHPCTKVVVNVADDVCEDGENNDVDELATPRKPYKGRGVATMQAKSVMAAQSGKLRDCTRAALSHCLDVLGVKLPSVSNRQQ